MEKQPSHSPGKNREVHLFALGRHGEAVIANHVLNKCVGVRVRRREDERAYTYLRQRQALHTQKLFFCCSYLYHLLLPEVSTSFHFITFPTSSGNANSGKMLC